MHGFCFIPNHEYGWLWSFIVIACLAMACKDLYDLTVSFYQEPVSTTISLNYPLDKRKVNTKIPNITICAEIQPSFNLYTYYIAKLEYENTTLSDDLDKLIEESQNITNITFNILTYHDFEPIIGQIRILLWFVNNFELSASYLEKIPLSGSKLSDYVHDSPPATDPTYPIIPGYPLSLFDEDYRNQIFKPLWREIKSRNITITQITKFLGSYVCKKQLSEYAVTAESFDGYRQNNQTVDHCSQNLVKYLDLYQVCFEIPIDLKSNSIIMTASSAKLTALVSGEPFDTLTLGSSKLPISMEQGQVKAVVQLQGQHMAYNCPSRPCLSGENLGK